jgi:hypothetical protein
MLFQDWTIKKPSLWEKAKHAYNYAAALAKMQLLKYLFTPKQFAKEI